MIFQIAEQQYQQKQLEVQAGYNQQLSRYIALQQVINYYKNEALPLSDEQIQASSLAYKLGNINYVQFIQNMEMAISTKQDFLKQQAAYFELSAQIKYIKEINYEDKNIYINYCTYHFNVVQYKE